MNSEIHCTAGFLYICTYVGKRSALFTDTGSAGRSRCLVSGQMPYWPLLLIHSKFISFIKALNSQCKMPARKRKGGNGNSSLYQYSPDFGCLQFARPPTDVPGFLSLHLSSDHCGLRPLLEKRPAAV